MPVRGYVDPAEGGVAPSSVVARTVARSASLPDEGTEQIGVPRKCRRTSGPLTRIHAGLPNRDAVDSPAALNSVSMMLSGGPAPTHRTRSVWPCRR